MPVDPTGPSVSTVAPVVDYEPPARPAAPYRSTHPAPLPQPTRPRRRHRPPRPAASTMLPASVRSAALFADAALRRILEVVDQRRPPTHLRTLLAAELAASVLAVRHTMPSRAEPATLQRVRVQTAGLGEPASAVEVFGTFRRGRRIHALACRVEAMPRTDEGMPWRIVALHIG